MKKKRYAKMKIKMAILCPNCTGENCMIEYAPCEDDDNYCWCPDCRYESTEDDFVWIYIEEDTNKEDNEDWF